MVSQGRGRVACVADTLNLLYRNGLDEYVGWLQSRLRSRDRRKFTIFHLKDDNGKFWVEMIIVTSLDAVATVDVVGTEHMITGHRTKGVV